MFISQRPQWLGLEDHCYMIHRGIKAQLRQKYLSSYPIQTPKLLFTGKGEVNNAYGIRLNIQAFPEICNMRKMRYSKIHQMSLPSPQVGSKPNSAINIWMDMCQKAAPLLFEAFPRWNYQPGVWQNDGALRGSTNRTSPGPLCAKDDFWHQSSFSWDRQPCQRRWKVPAAYLCLPGCVLSSVT